MRRYLPLVGAVLVGLNVFGGGQPVVRESTKQSFLEQSVEIQIKKKSLIEEASRYRAASQWYSEAANTRLEQIKSYEIDLKKKTESLASAETESTLNAIYVSIANVETAIAASEDAVGHNLVHIRDLLDREYSTLQEAGIVVPSILDEREAINYQIHFDNSWQYYKSAVNNHIMGKNRLGAASIQDILGGKEERAGKDLRTIRNSRR